MIRINILLVIWLAFAITLQGADNKKKHKFHPRFDSEIFENAEIDIEGGSIFIYPKYGDEQIIEITEDHDLFINGHGIDLDDDQQVLVKDFYDGFFEMIDRAKELGVKGAAIGLKGVGVGFTAIAGVCKLIDPDYDQEDLEKEIREETKKLEKEAEKLEDEADELKDINDELQDLSREMRDEIPELRETAIFDN